MVIIGGGGFLMFTYLKAGRNQAMEGKILLAESEPTPITVTTYSDKNYKHKLTYYIKGTKAHFELWGGPNEIDPFKELSRSIDYQDDDGTELYGVWSFAFTNAQWMEGLSANHPDS